MLFFCTTCDSIRHEEHCILGAHPVILALTDEQQLNFLRAARSVLPVQTALETHQVPLNTRAQVKACLHLLGKDTYYVFMEHYLYRLLWD